MGGAMQHDYEQAVPRQKSASGARMSVTLRHYGVGHLTDVVVAGR
jgi:hypothetical protein